MNTTQIELTKLLGKKELTKNCKLTWWTVVDDKESVLSNDGTLFDDWPEIEDEEIIGLPPPITDFHRWLNEKEIVWSQWKKIIFIDKEKDVRTMYEIPYDSSKELLKQSEETLKQIIELISNN